MKPSRKRLGILMLACGWLPAAADDLVEVYRLAADSDPVLAAAEASRRAAQEARPQALAQLLPEIGVSANRFRNDLELDGRQIGNRTETGSTREYDLQLSQPLYRRDRVNQFRQAGYEGLRADAELLAAEQDLIIRVAERYLLVLAALDQLTFATADKNAIDRQLEQATRRFEVGLVTITDVHEAQARYDLAVADEIDAERLLADRKEALRELTGSIHDRVAVMSDRFRDLPEVDPPNIELWVQKSLNNNPTLMAADLRVAISREEIDRQRAGHLPTVDLVASYSDRDQNDFGPKVSGSSIGVQLNLPLYSGGAVVSRTREAAYRLDQSWEEREQARREVERSTRDSYRGLESARSRIAALQQALVSTRSALEATEAGFEVGTRNIVDVLNAQRDTLRAQRDYSVSRYDYLINRLRLLRAAGQVNVDHLERINAWLGPEER